MTLYLHIGLHKTGTSSLQNFLNRNAEVLAKQGYLWPKAGLVAGGHHNIGYQLLGKPRFSAELGGLEELARELDGADAAIVSSEELEFLELAQVRALREGLGAREVRVIVYLRRQDELISSTYAQQVRMGANLGAFGDYVLQSLYHPRFDFSQLIGRWAGVFGREVLDVAVVSEETSGDRLLIDFLSRIGLANRDISFAWPGKRLNESPGANEIELIRRATRLARKGGRTLGADVLRHIHDAVAERVRQEPDLQTGKLTLDQGLFARVAGRFGAGNHKVAHEHVATKGQRAALEFTAAPAPGAQLARGPRLAAIAEAVAASLPQVEAGRG